MRPKLHEKQSMWAGGRGQCRWLQLIGSGPCIPVAVPGTSGLERGRGGICTEGRCDPRLRSKATQTLTSYRCGLKNGGQRPCNCVDRCRNGKDNEMAHRRAGAHVWWDALAANPISAFSALLGRSIIGTDCFSGKGVADVSGMPPVSQNNTLRQQTLRQSPCEMS